MVMQGFIKHLFVSISVTQNLFVSVFVHKCLMMLNDVEYTTFKMFVTQMSTYLFIISLEQESSGHLTLVSNAEQIILNYSSTRVSWTLLAFYV